METVHQGKQSILFLQPPAILSYASVVGKKEAEGPLAATFDVTNNDTKFGQKNMGKS